MPIYHETEDVCYDFQACVQVQLKGQCMEICIWMEAQSPCMMSKVINIGHC